MKKTPIKTEQVSIFEMFEEDASYDKETIANKVGIPNLGDGDVQVDNVANNVSSKANITTCASINLKFFLPLMYKSTSS